MPEYRAQKITGIVGGLGPLASAEFLKTIYECSLDEHEQYSPAVILYSDPSFPDRTEALRNGDISCLLGQLTGVLECLIGMGVSRIVVCCVTIHCLLPKLPEDLRGRIVSLLDIIFAQVQRSKSKHLLICTCGTRQSLVFESHQDWGGARPWIVLPDEDDQEVIHHQILYQIKKNRDPRQLIPVLESLLMKYDLDSFISGCTEMHVLAKEFLKPGCGGRGFNCLDPLMIIARELAGERQGVLTRPADENRPRRPLLMNDHSH